jgi:hypothetical protein
MQGVHVCHPSFRGTHRPSNRAQPGDEIHVYNPAAEEHSQIEAVESVHTARTRTGDDSGPAPSLQLYLF